jgi:sarcosine oxidase/L-pipecolate oxidase
MIKAVQGTIAASWYADSVDSSFLIFRIPNEENLFVASGGSGHEFKFLPVLSEHVVDVIEGKHTPYTRFFAWRGSQEASGTGWKRD